jgi:hypothetical protein
MADKPRNPFDINPDELDLEIRGQASMTRKVGLEEADAKHAYAQAKSRLAVVEARMKLKIKNDPESYGLPDGRPTVQDVKAAVVLTEEYQKALAEMDQAKFCLDIATVDTTAALDRRKMLERYVEILSLDYWSEREPRVHSEGARDMIEQKRRRRIWRDVDVE